MAVLVVLFASWLIFRGVGALGVAALETWQHSACYALAVMFIFTALAHFSKMKYDMEQMIPAVFPKRMLLVYITGVLEFLGAVGLLLPKFWALAGLCLIGLLVAMFTANLNAALKGVKLGGKPVTPLWIRTPMQILLIGLLWWSTRS